MLNTSLPEMLCNFSCLRVTLSHRLCTCNTTCSRYMDGLRYFVFWCEWEIMWLVLISNRWHALVPEAFDVTILYKCSWWLSNLISWYDVYYFLFTFFFLFTKIDLKTKILENMIWFIFTKQLFLFFFFFFETLLRRGSRTKKNSSDSNAVKLLSS